MTSVKVKGAYTHLHQKHISKLPLLDLPTLEG